MSAQVTGVIQMVNAEAAQNWWNAVHSYASAPFQMF